MNALAEALSSKPAPATDAFEIDMDEEDDEDDLRFHNACIDEIDRYRRIDEWIPSYHNVLSTTALDCKRRLIAAGAMPFRPAEFLQYTRDGTCDILRLTAFRNLLDLGLIRNEAVFHWFLSALGMDPSPHVRDRMLRLLNRSLGAVAIGEKSGPATMAAAQQDNLIIEQESSTDARRDDLARKQTVEGALKALKADMGGNKVLKEGLWDVITSPIASLREIGEVLQICELLYEPESSMIVVLKYPRYWRCAKVGKVCNLIARHFFLVVPPTLVFRRSFFFFLIFKYAFGNNLQIPKQATIPFSATGRIRTTPKMPIPIRLTLSSEPPAHPKIRLQVQPPKFKADSSGSSLTSASSSNLNVPSPPVARRILKPPKRPSPANGVGRGSPSGLGERLIQTRDDVDGREKEVVVKPKLTLKLSLKGAGAGLAKR